MFVIIGIVVVIGSVMGGYILAGGHLDVLWQPLEFLIIGGAATGALLIGNSGKVLGGDGRLWRNNKGTEIQESRLS
jgi:chemotaxis protein MotA